MIKCTPNRKTGLTGYVNNISIFHTCFKRCNFLTRQWWNLEFNYRKTGMKGMWMWIFEAAIVNRLYLIYNYDWTFIIMDTKNCQSILHLRFKIYSLRLQHSHLFSDYCYNVVMDTLIVVSLRIIIEFFIILV